MDQLADTRSLADDDVIRQDHGERLVADQLLGDEDRVSEAELLLLADVGDLGERADVHGTSALRHVGPVAVAGRPCDGRGRVGTVPAGPSIPGAIPISERRPADGLVAVLFRPGRAETTSRAVVRRCASSTRCRGPG